MRCLALENSKVVSRDLQLAEVGAQELLVAVSRCAVDGRADPQGAWGKIYGTHAQFLGSEVVGKVVAIGNRVSRFRVGDVVAAICYHGGAAEKVVVEESAAVLKPSELDPSIAVCAIKPALVAYSAIFYKMRVNKGDMVLILSDSFQECLVSLLSAQLAQNLGAVVTICVRSEHEKHKLAVSEGLCCKVLVVALDGEKELEHATNQLLTASDGLGFDHIFDARRDGSNELWLQAFLASLASHGSMVFQSCSLVLSPRDSFHLAARGASVGFVSEVPFILSPTKRWRVLHIMEDVLHKLETRVLLLPPVKELSLSSAAPQLQECIARGREIVAIRV